VETELVLRKSVMARSSQEGRRRTPAAARGRTQAAQRSQQTQTKGLTMSEMAIVAIVLFVGAAIMLFLGFWSVTHQVAKAVDTLQEMNKTLDFINKHVSERHRLLVDVRRHLP
jgi:hypothetical protein